MKSAGMNVKILIHYGKLRRLKMTTTQLWDKIIADNAGTLSENGTLLVPIKEYKINNDTVDHLNKDENGKVTVTLKHVDMIDHPGEDIDYSLYGSPKD